MELIKNVSKFQFTYKAFSREKKKKNPVTLQCHLHIQDEDLQTLAKKKKNNQSTEENTAEDSTQ